MTILGSPRRIHWLLLLTLSAFVVVAPLASQSTKANSIPEPASTPQVSPSPQEPPPQLIAEPKAERATPTTLEQQRQAQIEADTKRLYQLCVELRAEVAKTYKESLSVAVMKKAGEVEALSKSLKMLMNREAAANH